jgi:hypothetical protein
MRRTDMRIKIFGGIYDDPARLSADGQTVERMDIDTGEWHPTPYRVGAVGTLERALHITDGWVKYRLDFSGKGIPGNSDPETCLHHGWRGTTYNIEITALGVRRIKSLRELKRGGISVKLSDDFAPDLP